MGATERGEHVGALTRSAGRVRPHASKSLPPHEYKELSLASLPDDVILVLGRVLANPLLHDLCRFASASRCLRAVLKGMMFEQHMWLRDMRSLVRKAGSSLDRLATASILAWPDKGLNVVHCAVLASIIRSVALPQLTELSLLDNMIGNAGVRTIAEACAGGVLPQLTSLNLCYNEIGDAGVQVLAGALASGALPQLTYLNLGGNYCIGDAGALALAAALASSRPRAQLTKLLLHDTNIRYAGALAIVKVLGCRIGGPATELSFFQSGGKLADLPIRPREKSALIAECFSLRAHHGRVTLNLYVNRDRY